MPRSIRRIEYEGSRGWRMTSTFARWFSRVPQLTLVRAEQAPAPTPPVAIAIVRPSHHDWLRPYGDADRVRVCSLCRATELRELGWTTSTGQPLPAGPPLECPGRDASYGQLGG